MLANPREAYTRSLWSVRAFQKEERSATREAPALEIRNIDASYGAHRVLHDVSVRVPQGSTVAIVGESGSGKSTLARVVTGLLPPDHGRILFKGIPLAPAARSRDRTTLRKIQMVYQSADTSLNPRQTVRDIIGRPMRLYFGLKGAERERRVLELLDAIELDATYADRLSTDLSGGQKQRVAIARALAAEPEVIVCDEVTSALDQVVQEEILKLLTRLQDMTAVSYVFITHDVATVRAIADEIVVMNQGRVVEQGTRQGVLSPPHPDYTRLLLSSVPEMDPDWLTHQLEARGAG